MVVQWPVPIVFSRGALVPIGVFALMFVAFSGVSTPPALAAVALLGGIGGVVSLIVHELGHVSIARRRSGVTPEKVKVMSLGAAAHFDGSYRNGREQARMALGGPEASFAFALSMMIPVLLPAPFLLKVGALGLAFLNVGIGGLSLLPVHPLDVPEARFDLGHQCFAGQLWKVGQPLRPLGQHPGNQLFETAPVVVESSEDAFEVRAQLRVAFCIAQCFAGVRGEFALLF